MLDIQNQVQYRTAFVFGKRLIVLACFFFLAIYVAVSRRPTGVKPNGTHFRIV